MPRGGLSQSSLPSARKVSFEVHHKHSKNNKDGLPITLMVMQFGQFLDHDLSLTPERELHCCSDDVLAEDATSDPELRFCFNIDIDQNDLFYSKRSSCHPFTRSDSICTDSGKREQFNLLTSFIDGSNVYGSDNRRATGLRLMKDGLLKTHRLGPTMPTAAHINITESITNNGEELVAGDIRAVEQPGLASMHSLFLNEHNRVARAVKAADTSMTDEQIYQHARRIVIAELQNIVYSEFLPVVLGPAAMEQFKLKVSDNLSTYDNTVDPSISNEFATFAFRFGHALIPNFLR